MGRNLAETFLGGMVIVVAATFLYFFLNTAQVKAVSGYQITAKFFKVGGMNPGSDVRISGINVGTVSETTLDPETFDAVVVMTIKPSVRLPKDTIATIASGGLIGGKYVRLKPGNSKDLISEGGVIEKTEDFKSLEDQVGEIIFLATGGDDSK